MISAIRALFAPSQDGKLGTFMGVFVPNILQMVGVILFMRLGWILGQVGTTQMTLIISLSSLLLFITSLSLTSTVSNMKMEGGGSYYLISRTLGIEFGSAIGILFSMSQLISIALCISGFALSLQDFFPTLKLEVIEIITLSLLMGLSYLSNDLALKTQLLIFIALSISIGAIFLGSGENIPDSIKPLEGLATNLSFWGAFALFFPAATGIESGLSMSGDLKRPSRSIPIGALASVILAFFLYVNISFFLASEVSSDLLKSHPFIIYHLTKYGHLVMLGVWGATLSSALGSILSGPKIIQALAKDGIFPSLFSKPLVNNFFMYGAVLAMILLIDLNHILPMLTMTCLVSYGLINFCAFFEELIHNPSWRPTFHLSKMISLSGTLGCLIAMFMINPGASFIVIALTIALCVWTSSRHLNGNFDDIRYSLYLYFINKAILALSHLAKNAKSWRPHILSIVQGTTVDKNLAFFSHALNQEKGFLTFGISLPESPHPREQFTTCQAMVKNDLKVYQIPSYVHINLTHTPNEGAHEILTNYGLGPLKPNTVIRLFDEEIFKIEFASFLIDTYAYGKNTILLKTDPVSPVFTQKQNETKEINLWWGGEYRGNFELCLALSHLLQMSELWHNASIIIKTVVKDKETEERKIHQFDRFRARLRLKHLSFCPIIDPSESFFPNLVTASLSADLTFLGMRSPLKGETASDYQAYFLNLFKETSHISNIAYVLSGETLDFEKIFFE
ncbi:MAG: hypothetical protein KBC64_05790 [Simkaniaceae bacterium]|nr:hypothetical protein [Simkaniaceae bacterium]